MKNYKAIGKIGEGTFSEVMKMQSLRDGNYYACKQMKQHFESIEQVNNLREIQALRRLNPHPNILALHEVVFDKKSGSLALICELMDMNIYELIRGFLSLGEGDKDIPFVAEFSSHFHQHLDQSLSVLDLVLLRRVVQSPHVVMWSCAFNVLGEYEALITTSAHFLDDAGRRHPLSEKKIMHYMYQLCKSLDHMHRNGIFHRDVKPENILVKQDVLKLGDFGSCRSVYSKQPYTEYISTRWYRAPECLLTDGFYTYKMDLWSAGCVFYEIASLQPLFPGVNELDQISKIHDVIGTPCQKTLTKFKQSRAMSFDFPFKKGSGIPLLTTNLSPQCLSLLHAMVAYDPDERIAAHQALQHPYFQAQRATEMQALANHRRTYFPKYPMVPEPLSHNWSFSKEARKQKQPLRREEDHARKQGPASLMELPKLRLSGVTRLPSCSGPRLRSVLGAGTNGRVPVLGPLRCAGVNKKTDTQQDIKPNLKQYQLPTINRKGSKY